MYGNKYQILYRKTGVFRGMPIFLIFAPNHRLWDSLEPRTYYLCYGAKIRKKNLQTQLFFLYIKVKFKGVYFSWTCSPDVIAHTKLVLIRLNPAEVHIIRIRAAS